MSLVIFKSSVMPLGWLKPKVIRRTLLCLVE